MRTSREDKPPGKPRMSYDTWEKEPKLGLMKRYMWNTAKLGVWEKR